MSNTANQTMEKFLLYLDQLYDSNKEIRAQAELTLNQHLIASLSIQSQFDLLQTLPDHYQLKMVIFLKAWIYLHYDQCAEAVQRSMSQYFIARDSYFFQPKIQSHIIQIISFIIQKEYPNSELLHHLVIQQSYTEYILQILEEVFTNLDNKKHSLVGFYAIVYPKLKMYFFTQESLTPMLNIYLLIIRSRFNHNELLLDIIHQWKLVSHQEYVNLYLKFIWRYLQQPQRQVSQQQFRDIVDTIMAYIQQLKDSIPIYIRSFQDLQLISSYHFQNSNLIVQIHCKIIKILTSICKRQNQFITPQYTIVIIEFCLQYGIQMDIKQFYEFVTTQDDFQLTIGLYNLSLRDAAINLIRVLIDYRDEKVIGEYMLKQLSTQTLNMNQDFRSILRKEALYFVVQKIYPLIQNEIDMNQWYEDSLSIYLNIDNILFLPIKLSILSLIGSVQKRHQLFSQNTKLINQLLSILSTSNVHPLQSIAMLQLLSSQDQENFEVRQYLASTIPQIKQVYITCSNDQNKFEILKLMINLLNIGLELKYLITVIIDEWNIAVKEQHQYKSKTLMLLKIIKLLIEQQQLTVYAIFIETILEILLYSFKNNYHLLLSHEIFHLILRQYLNSNIRFNNKYQEYEELFQQNMDRDEDTRQYIIWNYLFVSILNKSNCQQVINFYQAYTNTNEHLPSVLFDLVALNMFRATRNELKELIFSRLSSNVQSADIGQLLIWIAIQNKNKYDVKQFIFELEEQLGRNVLIQLVDASVLMCKQDIDYRSDLLIKFLRQLQIENHLIFDMSYINLNLDINETIKQACLDLHTNKSLTIFESILNNYFKAFKIRLQITEGIQQMHRLESLQLQFQQMELQ